MFYLVCQNVKQRSELIDSLKQQGIHAVFHYLSLHKSPFYAPRYQGPALLNADRFSDHLVRLPLFFELEDAQVDRIAEAVICTLAKYPVCP